MLRKHFIRTLASSISRPSSQAFTSRPTLSKPSLPAYSSGFSTLPLRMAEFKLKELSSLDLKNGDKVEAEVEGIEGGKVLLIKLDDKVHAMNAKCTHYGAPLKTGVLAPDGRLTCPWHGGEQVSKNPFRYKLRHLSLLQHLNRRCGRRASPRRLEQV
jgi:nitrite reductase/ring-hydroxylating ferredoxin subunit